MKYIITVASVLLLCSCAPEWEKAGATSDDLSAAESACHDSAEMNYPPALHQVMLQQAHTTANKSACFGSPSLIDCLNTRDIFVPPQMETVDDNQAPRDKAFKACLVEKGWHPMQ